MKIRKIPTKEAFFLPLWYLMYFFVVFIIVVIQKNTMIFGYATISVVVAIIFFCFFSVFAYQIGNLGGLRLKILALFFGYIGIIFSFGAVYYLLQGIDGMMFRKTESVLALDVTEEIKTKELKIKNLNKEILILTILHSNPEQGAEAIRDKGKRVKVTDTLEIEYTILVGAGPAQTFFTTYYKGNKYSLGSVHPLNPRTRLTGGLSHGKESEEFQSRIGDFITYLSFERDLLKDSLVSLIEENIEFYLLDFIYFSASKMTSLGFNDITPINPKGRFLIFIQAILSVAYIGYAMSFFWSSKDKDSNQ